MARGMCEAEVSSSQRCLVSMPASRALNTAFSKVLREADSITRRSRGTPMLAKNKAARSASVMPVASSSPSPPVNNNRRPGCFCSSGTAAVIRSAASFRATWLWPCHT